MKMLKHILTSLLLLPLALLAQNSVKVPGGGTKEDKYLKEILNWYNGAEYGMSTDLAYEKLLAGKKSEPVVVAVIDSGVDIEHSDLKGRIWVNTDEIAGNGVDDDKNGYIDDVNGWSFLGNPDGENVTAEQLEVTRLYVKLKPKYDGVSEADAENKTEYALYQKCKKHVEAERADTEKTVGYLKEIATKAEEADTKLKAHFKRDYTMKDLKKVMKDKSIQDPSIGTSASLMYTLKTQGLDLSSIQHYVEIMSSSLNAHYNLELNARAIVGDNPDDFNDIYYGSKDCEGPDAFHGTHCAGIIGALRGNGIGNDGVADNVLIMSIRAVPDGDERDKDVALAIRYAVDNGAQVCNMSFGKSFTAYPEEVIKAIRYAESKGVLLVHAAGNDGKDTGLGDNYPTPIYEGMTERFSNWIEVGASTRYGSAVNDDKKPENSHDGLAASFSNYSDKIVDIFAPGLEIYSTVPQSDWDKAQGTSMAAPMVTGVAALLKSYFPNLTMIQIKDIILKSGQDVSTVITPIPGGTEEVEFKKLCITGRIANVYNAVEMATQVSAGN
jgi:subtilisin family serine protease